MLQNGSFGQDMLCLDLLRARCNMRTAGYALKHACSANTDEIKRPAGVICVQAPG